LIYLGDIFKTLNKFSNILNIDSNISDFKYLNFYSISFNNILKNSILGYNYTLINNPNHIFLTPVSLNFNNNNYYYLRNFRDRLTELGDLLVNNLENYTIELNINNVNNYNQIFFLLENNNINQIFLKDSTKEYLINKDYLMNYNYNNTSIKIIYDISLENNNIISNFKLVKTILIKFTNNINLINNSINNILFSNKRYSKINLDAINKNTYLLNSSGVLLVL
jgi:hypothetical protein